MAVMMLWPDPGLTEWITSADKKFRLKEGKSHRRVSEESKCSLNSFALFHPVQKSRFLSLHYALFYPYYDHLCHVGFPNNTGLFLGHIYHLAANS